jgi:RNA polymerase sigma-70 factor (ECF subfamily)
LTPTVYVVSLRVAQPGSASFRVNQSLLERIAAGDAGAVKECMDAYGNLVWALARRLSASAADAEDAAQEIFLDIWKSAGRYDATVASEAVFITTIARRRLIDRLRARKRRPVTEEFDEERSPFGDDGNAGAVAVDVSIASRALAQLGDAQREILLLGIVDGMTHSEIATATGKPLGTVKTQMRRGLIKIRELLGTVPSPEEEP